MSGVSDDSGLIAAMVILTRDVINLRRLHNRFDTMVVKFASRTSN